MRRLRTDEPIAVVVGLQHLTALATVRSLSREGVPVTAITSKPRSPLAKTKGCQKLCYEDVNGAPLFDTLLKLGETLEERAVLVPCSDAQVYLISEHWASAALLSPRPALEGSRGSFDRQGLICDLRRAEWIDRSTAFEERLRGFSLPCILKPWVRTRECDRHNPVNKVLRLEDRESLSRAVSRSLEWVEHLILREWIEGADSDVYFCLMYLAGNSHPQATFVGEKRQWLPEIGSTASAEKGFDENVLNESIRLFAHVRNVGIGSVEFKFDRKNKQFKITEPTVGRPNLQSYIAVANGINIPHIAYRNLIGDPIRQLDQTSANGSVRWIHEGSEYYSVRYHMRRSDLTLGRWYRSIRGPK